VIDQDPLTNQVEQLLLDLGAQGSTGCLYVKGSDGDEAEVYLRDGSVYSVYVPGRRPLLGTRLMSAGVLAPENLAEVLDIQRSDLPGMKLGELLVNLGIVDREIIESFVSEQLVDQLTDLLGWRVASWKFRKNRRTRSDVAPPQDVSTLLEELRRRRAHWVELRGVVGGASQVPLLSAKGTQVDDVVVGPGEWAMLCKIDGVRSLVDLSIDCGFTLYEGAQVVASLVGAGLVDVDLPELGEGDGHEPDENVPDESEPDENEPADDADEDSLEDGEAAGELADPLEADPASAAADDSMRTLAALAAEAGGTNAGPDATSEEIALAVARVTRALEDVLSGNLDPEEAARRVAEQERRRTEAVHVAALLEEARQKEQERIKQERAERAAQAQAVADARAAAEQAVEQAQAAEAARVAEQATRQAAEEAARVAQEQAAEQARAAQAAREAAQAEAAQAQARADAERAAEAARLAEEQAAEQARAAQAAREAEEAAERAEEEARAQALAAEQAQRDAEEAERVAEEQRQADEVARAAEAARLAEEQERAARLAREAEAAEAVAAEQAAAQARAAAARAAEEARLAEAEVAHRNAEQAVAAAMASAPASSGQWGRSDAGLHDGPSLAEAAALALGGLEPLATLPAPPPQHADRVAGLAPPAETATAAAADSSRTNRDGADTAALLRELSGLFASAGGDEPERPAPTQTRTASPRVDDSKAKKKKGLFGR